MEVARWTGGRVGKPMKAGNGGRADDVINQFGVKQRSG